MSIEQYLADHKEVMSAPEFAGAECLLSIIADLDGFAIPTEPGAQYYGSVRLLVGEKTRAVIQIKPKHDRSGCVLFGHFKAHLEFPQRQELKTKFEAAVGPLVADDPNGDPCRELRHYPRFFLATLTSPAAQQAFVKAMTWVKSELAD